MVTTATLVTLSTTSAGGWKNDAGASATDAHTRLSDGSDTTYCYDSTGAAATLTVTTLATPTSVNLAGIESLNVRVRGQGNGGTGTGLGHSVQIAVRGGTFSQEVHNEDPTTPAWNTSTKTAAGTSTAPSKTDINSLVLTLTAAIAGSSNLSTTRVIEAQVQLTHDPQPVVGMHMGF